MQDIPTGWKDSTSYRKILIPKEVRRTLQRLGPVGDCDGRLTCAFNRLDEKKNLESHVPAGGGGGGRS